LNIHNADEAYIDQAKFIEQRLKDRGGNEHEAIKYCYGRIKEIADIEQLMLKNGRIPYDDDEEGEEHQLKMEDEEHLEFEII